MEARMPMLVKVQQQKNVIQSSSRYFELLLILVFVIIIVKGVLEIVSPSGAPSFGLLALLFLGLSLTAIYYWFLT